jgi:hypothetical protein
LLPLFVGPVKAVQRTVAPRRIAEIRSEKEDNEFLAFRSFATIALTFGNLQYVEK